MVGIGAAGGVVGGGRAGWRGSGGGLERCANRLNAWWKGGSRGGGWRGKDRGGFGIGVGTDSVEIEVLVVTKVMAAHTMQAIQYNAIQIQYTTMQHNTCNTIQSPGPPPPASALTARRMMFASCPSTRRAKTRPTCSCSTAAKRAHDERAASGSEQNKTVGCKEHHRASVHTD